MLMVGDWILSILAVIVIVVMGTAMVTQQVVLIAALAIAMGTMV